MSIRKLLKIFAISGLALANGCGSAPKVSPCLVRSESGGCFYAPQGSDEVKLRPFRKSAFEGEDVMEKNICFTPQEHQIIVEWIKRHGGKHAEPEVLRYESMIKNLEAYDVNNAK